MISDTRTSLPVSAAIAEDSQSKPRLKPSEEGVDRPHENVLALDGSCGLSRSAHSAGDKRQRDEGRDDGRGGDGDGELAEELPRECR